MSPNLYFPIVNTLYMLQPFVFLNVNKGLGYNLLKSVIEDQLQWNFA